MKLWHALRREVVGAWRSVRYDLDTHRAVRLAGAFTKEFEPSADAPRSRLVPFTGVVLLLLGGGLGTALAVGAGMSALGSNQPPVTDPPPVAAATGTAEPQPARTVHTTGSGRHRPAARPTAAPSSPGVAPVPSRTPILEDTALPPSPSPTGTEPSSPSTSTSPSPTQSPSSGASSSAPDPEQ